MQVDQKEIDCTRSRNWLTKFNPADEVQKTRQKIEKNRRNDSFEFSVWWWCVCVTRRLDYDRRASHSYNFTIIAADNGKPSHRGSANVRVSVTNVNDEDPVFIQPVEHVLVSEDAPLNTVVHVIQAYDPDGDDVTFAFSGKLTCPQWYLLYLVNVWQICEDEEESRKSVVDRKWVGITLCFLGMERSIYHVVQSQSGSRSSPSILHKYPKEYFCIQLADWSAVSVQFDAACKMCFVFRRRSSTAGTVQYWR